MGFFNDLTGAGRAADIAATIAVTGVLASAFVSSWISRRTNYVNSVTAERTKWIGKLRANMSSLIGDYRTFDSVTNAFRNEQFYKDARKSFETLAAEIRLQLNPAGAVDKSLLALLAKFMSNWNAPGFGFAAWEDLFINHGQWLLKAEWEKVKQEARGPFGRTWHSMDAKRREVE